MKLVLVAIGLLVAGIGVGVACGPKESFCYAEGKPCADVKREMLQLDATFDGFVFKDANLYHCAAPDGATFDSVDPCPN